MEVSMDTKAKLPNFNAQDPLRQRPDQERELFDRFSKAAVSFSADFVIGAALNLVLNAIRQVYPSRESAHKALDEKFGIMKGLLDRHYDPVTGKRRNVFPFTQVVNAQHVNDKDLPPVTLRRPN
jgi:hypothetical protein